MRLHLGHHGLNTRHHHRIHRIDRRDTNTFPTLQNSKDLRLRRANRHHRTARRQRLHQTATRPHQGTRIRKRQHCRHVSRRDLTNGMAHHHIRSYTPRLHQPEKRHLQREQPRLGVRRLIQQLTLAEHHPLQGAAQHIVQMGTHLVEGLSEHRERRIQLSAHADTLRTLTREQQAQAAWGELAHHRGG
jgi:hypothetical protein